MAHVVVLDITPAGSLPVLAKSSTKAWQCCLGATGFYPADGAPLAGSWGYMTGAKVQAPAYQRPVQFEDRDSNTNDLMAVRTNVTSYKSLTMSTSMDIVTVHSSKPMATPC